jgi:hypothetical protein
MAIPMITPAIPPTIAPTGIEGILLDVPEVTRK